MEKITEYLIKSTVNESIVRAWHEDVCIPTYETGKAEKNPIFLEKRVYQGSSGVVYPYPVIEKIEDEKRDKVYKAVFLENEYIKVMILPELGGRIQMAYDKIKQRHFIYYNQVIKPALVGLTGPWISGGIEFNWPQHHRPGTFLPVDHTIENNPDGSATVWVSENEKMFHQKGMAGFTLYPGKAYLEIKGKLYNPTPFPQTFLWWANPAVAVNEHYQSVFPPDVHAVFDHGKRDVSSFPIATGTYYKIDYSAGVDISNYKNIPVPTSYMAINSEFNFVGGYENDTRAGVLHVANHHISPGKKQWTWGNGDFGKAWDRNLTDEDGPYIELMAGVFTDNQPDFSWMNPYEEKTFTQYFLPYRELGVVKNASQDLLLNIERSGDKVIVKVFATSLQKNAKIRLSPLNPPQGDFEEEFDLSPENVYVREIFVGDTSPDDLCLTVYASNGSELLAIRSEKQERPAAEAAKPALSPEETPTCEQLYLTGLHLEQYRHATYSATDYYREALRRDPSDVRNNNAMGLWLLRRGKFAESEQYFRKAIDTQLQHNPNPYDGEPHYNLGLALQYQGRNKEAYDAFYKSCWNAAMQDAGYLGCAQLSCLNHNLSEALYEVDKSLIRNWHNHKARVLKTAILRKLGRADEALKLIEDSLKIDLFNFGCHFEKFLLTDDIAVLNEMYQLMHGQIHTCEVLALDYIAAGLYDEAIRLLEEGIKVCSALEVLTSPMTYYYLGWAMQLAGYESKTIFEKAAAHAPDYCFPNRLEAIAALTCAQKVNPADAKAPYYLGNLWYDKRQYPEAIACWEKSVKIDESFPTVLRNLSLASFNKLHLEAKAVEYLEKAFSLDTSDSRILMELDQLYKRLCRPHKDRLAFLDKYFHLVEQRDDVYLEYITLCNQLGNYTKAIELIDRHIFHPWEGGEGKVPAQYQLARVELAKQLMNQNEYQQAIKLLNECLEYPHNLGEGKLHGAQENDFHYWLGCAYEGSGEMEIARHYWNLAKDGIAEPAAAIFYNDQKPDKIFYQGLALLKLGMNDEANIRFDKLIAFGREHLNETIILDYFAVSLPDLLIWEDDLTYRNKIHCHYMLGLGYYGLGDVILAKKHLQEAANMDVNHQGVQVHIEMVN
jgi:tetratricopeptide (TPR) repeat protein